MRLQKNIQLLIFLIACCTVSAQSNFSEKRIHINKVPQKIVDYVQKKYSNHKSKYYKITIDDSIIQYEVTLKKEKDVTFIIFDDNALIIRSSHKIDYKIIPDEIKQKIHKDLSIKFSKYKIGKCKRYSHKGIEFYEIKLTANKKKHIYQYDSDGQFMKSKLSPDKHSGPIFHR